MVDSVAILVLDYVAPGGVVELPTIVNGGQETTLNRDYWATRADRNLELPSLSLLDLERTVLNRFGGPF